MLLAVLWSVQAHVLGYGIEDFRWFDIIHIPLAFGVLLLVLYLTVLTWCFSRPNGWNQTGALSFQQLHTSPIHQCFKPRRDPGDSAISD